MLKIFFLWAGFTVGVLLYGYATEVQRDVGYTIYMMFVQGLFTAFVLRKDLNATNP